MFIYLKSADNSHNFLDMLLTQALNASPHPLGPQNSVKESSAYAMLFVVGCKTARNALTFEGGLCGQRFK
jgi:hypothetical protein